MSKQAMSKHPVSKQVKAGVAWLALGVLTATHAPLAAATDEGCTVGTTANLNFTLASLAGGEVRLSDYQGQVVLINFWATWCTPCRKEIPWLNELHEKYRERGLVVLGVSVDESVPLIEPFIRTLQVSYPVLIGKDREDVKEALGPLLGFPTSVLVSRAGKICTRHTGIISKAQLDREINALL